MSADSISPELRAQLKEPSQRAAAEGPEYQPGDPVLAALRISYSDLPRWLADHRSSAGGSSAEAA